MNITTYFLIPLVLFVILLYPLVRKAVALLEILVNKQVPNYSGKASEYVVYFTNAI